MRNDRMPGLRVAGAVALSLALAASAQAAKHVNTGPVKFHAASGRSEVIIVTGGVTPNLVCAESHAVGEIAPAATLTIKYDGCGAAVKDCASQGSALGRITTNLLASNLGYVRAPGEVGLDFRAAEGEVLFEFRCPGEKELVGRLKGSVIGRLTPVNKTTTTFKLELKAAGGKQEVERFEGGLNDTLTGEVSLEDKPFETGAAREIVSQTISDDPQVVGKKRYADPAMVKTKGAALEWGRCRRSKNASYHDANCTLQEPASDRDGKFEFFPVPS